MRKGDKMLCAMLVDGQPTGETSLVTVCKVRREDRMQEVQTDAARSKDDHRLVKIDSGMAPDAGAHLGKVLVFAQPQELTLALPPAHMTGIGP